MLSEGVAAVLVPLESENEPTFFHSLSVSAPDILESQSGGPVQNLLESGANVDDALYSMDVNDVACMDRICNKRISDAGPERSAGRPGNRPFGASSAACPSLITACLGLYGNASRQPHHTGPNTREETYTASSTTGRLRDQSTSQPAASSSRRPTAEDRASPATVALYPRRPPYFCGGQDEDVHI